MTLAFLFGLVATLSCGGDFPHGYEDCRKLAEFSNYLFLYLILAGIAYVMSLIPGGAILEVLARLAARPRA